MGVYHISSEKNNERPVWKRHFGREYLQKLFYSKGKVILWCLRCYTDIDIKDGKWKIGKLSMKIGSNQAKEGRVEVQSLEANLTTWPNQVTKWQYRSSRKWHDDPLLTVTGDIN